MWLALLLFQRGLHAQAVGWLSRTQRLLEEAELDSAARGYLLVPLALQALERDHEGERDHELFEDVSTIARRFDDSNLTFPAGPWSVAGRDG